MSADPSVLCFTGDIVREAGELLELRSSFPRSFASSFESPRGPIEIMILSTTKIV
jgi:hypothetical protein